MYQPLRKAQLAHDRASRARRRSGKDSAMLSPTLSETSEQTEGIKELEKKDEECKELEKKVEESKEQEKKDEDKGEKSEGSKELEKKDEGNEKPKAMSEDNIRLSRKRKRHESEKSQESKCAKIEEYVYN